MGKGQNKPIVNYVQNEETVDPGEVFYTSGDDRVFPKGMPVGTATVVRQGKNFKEIYITPSAFQNGIEEVLIVLEGVHRSDSGTQDRSGRGGEDPAASARRCESGRRPVR